MLQFESAFCRGREGRGRIRQGNGQPIKTVIFGERASKMAKPVFKAKIQRRRDSKPQSLFRILDPTVPGPEDSGLFQNSHLHGYLALAQASVDI